MKIIQPHKISGEILQLIIEAKQYLLIVSPYVDLRYWKQLESELLKAKERGVRIDFFVRNEAENSSSWEQIENLGIEPRLINNLHAKFYFNEKHGVMSSMNLLSSSNSSSIEIGCQLETKEELEELKSFVKSFIIPNEAKEKPDKEDLYLSKEKFSIALERYISNRINATTSIRYHNGNLKIKTPTSNYDISIDKVENKISIWGIISNEEEIMLKDPGNYFKSSYFQYQILEGGKGCYSRIQGLSVVRLSNSFLDHLRVNEKKELLKELADFVYSVSEFKRQLVRNSIT